MRSTNLIVKLLISLILLLILTTGVAQGSSPSPESSPPASVTTAVQDEASDNNSAVFSLSDKIDKLLKPGCPTSTHVNPIVGPWDGGQWLFPPPNERPINLGIIKGWENLKAPQIINDPTNPGQPTWDQAPFKVLVTPKLIKQLGGTKVRFVGLGGEAYLYKKNPACVHNVPLEFRRGSEMVVTLKRMVNMGLARIYD